LEDCALVYHKGPYTIVYKWMDKMGFEHGSKSRYGYRPIIFSISIIHSGNDNPNIGRYYKVNIIFGTYYGVTLCCKATTDTDVTHKYAAIV